MAPYTENMTQHLLARSESCVKLDTLQSAPRRFVKKHSGSAVRRCFSVPNIPAKMSVAPSPVVVVKPIYTRHGRSPRQTSFLHDSHGAHFHHRYYYNTPFWPRYTGPTFSHADSRYNLKYYYFPGSLYEPRWGWSALGNLDPAYYWRRGQVRSRDVEYDPYYGLRQTRLGLGQGPTWASTYFPFGHTSSYRYYHDNDALRHG